MIGGLKSNCNFNVYPNFSCIFPKINLFQSGTFPLTEILIAEEVFMADNTGVGYAKIWYNANYVKIVFIAVFSPPSSNTDFNSWFMPERFVFQDLDVSGLVFLTEKKTST